MDVIVESKKKEKSSAIINSVALLKKKPTSSVENVPSGFILKLYQMVNGAPDEVITWTPSGDAFIIGSDLNRLESETLPQYFRHNRFQSLVRQLNFYSFRKINRERNVWIYKHSLFHRDHPEHLHKVRRRTCPGVDGRKQRFSRLMAHKLSKNDNEQDGDLSSEDDSVEEQQQQGLGNGSQLFSNAGEISSENNFASRSVVNARNARIVPLKLVQTINDNIVVDTSMMSNLPSSPNSVRDSIFELHDSADDGSNIEMNSRSDMMHSLIVSDVANKLEAYVKRVMKERGLSRTRRSGIVTPPFGSSFTMTSRGLITYDDECRDTIENTGEHVVTDTDDSTSSEANEPCVIVDKEMLVAPVLDFDIVKRISTAMVDIGRKTSYKSNGEVFRACANVAAFFMCTAPEEQSDLCCSKVLQLLSTSNQLEAEFYFYRSALHPDLFFGSIISHNGGFSEAQSAALCDSLTRGAGKLEALREFKVFAVNLIYKFLNKTGRFSGIKDLPVADHTTLLQSVEIWAKGISCDM